MSGLSTLLEIGKKSLFASQSAIQVTGNNISNANTEGYSRQAVRLEDGEYSTTATGQLGTGVNAVEIYHYFDEFIETQYLSKSSEEQRWETVYDNLQGVETLFNEANSSGLNSALSAFWDSWSTLSTDPSDTNARTELISNSMTLTGLIQSLSDDLNALQDQVDDVITKEVNEVNTLIDQIAELNVRITSAEGGETNQAIDLRDERSAQIRELAEKLDIKVIDNGAGNLIITTTAGQTLVDGSSTFRLAFENAQVINDVRRDTTDGSLYDGTIQYSGESSSEYLVKIVDGGALGSATFKVSVDGGATWLADKDGNTTFTADDEDGSVLLPDGRLRIYFDGTTELTEGDSFTILPQKSLFWYQTASSSLDGEGTGKVNVTSRILPNGEDDERRLVGGSLAGLFQFRDASVGSYLEKLDAFSESMIWEVNRLHSQGAGTDTFTEVVGTNEVLNTGVALGTPSSGLDYAKKLTAGNLSISIYDDTTGSVLQSQALDFDAAAGTQNFDPDTHSMEDLVAAINRTFGSSLTAAIEDGHLQITAADGVSFAFGTDSTGLVAALGVNTFFEGTDAESIAVNSTVRTNIAYISTGHVNGAGEINDGDNTTAANIASLQTTNVAVTTVGEGTTWQTLDEYYSTLVAKAGSDTQSAQFTYEYQQALAENLRSRQDEVTGVNLDEEMTNLIKFQHAYTAAAKLITTAESMMEVLLGLKQ